MKTKLGIVAIVIVSMQSYFLPVAEGATEGECYSIAYSHDCSENFWSYGNCAGDDCTSGGGYLMCPNWDDGRSFDLGAGGAISKATVEYVFEYDNSDDLFEDYDITIVSCGTSYLCDEYCLPGSGGFVCSKTDSQHVNDADYSGNSDCPHGGGVQP